MKIISRQASTEKISVTLTTSVSMMKCTCSLDLIDTEARRSAQFLDYAMTLLPRLANTRLREDRLPDGARKLKTSLFSKIEV